MTYLRAAYAASNDFSTVLKLAVTLNVVFLLIFPGSFMTNLLALVIIPAGIAYICVLFIEAHRMKREKNTILEMVATKKLLKLLNESVSSLIKGEEDAVEGKEILALGMFLHYECGISLEDLNKFLKENNRSYQFTFFVELKTIPAIGLEYEYPSGGCVTVLEQELI